MKIFSLNRDRGSLNLELSLIILLLMLAIVSAINFMGFNVANRFSNIAAQMAVSGGVSFNGYDLTANRNSDGTYVIAFPQSPNEPYTVQVSSNQTTWSTKTDQDGSNTNEVVIIQPSNGVKYYRIVDNAGNATDPVVITGPIPPPPVLSDITAVQAPISATLNWSDVGAPSYDIYRKNALFGTYVKIASAIAATTFVDNSANNPGAPPVAGTSYMYKVISTEPDSVFSNVKTALFQGAFNPTWTVGTVPVAFPCMTDNFISFTSGSKSTEPANEFKMQILNRATGDITDLGRGPAIAGYTYNRNDYVQSAYNMLKYNQVVGNYAIQLAPFKAYTLTPNVCARVLKWNGSSWVEIVPFMDGGGTPNIGPLDYQTGEVRISKSGLIVWLNNNVLKSPSTCYTAYADNFAATKMTRWTLMWNTIAGTDPVFAGAARSGGRDSYWGSLNPDTDEWAFGAVDVAQQPAVKPSPNDINNNLGWRSKVYKPTTPGANTMGVSYLPSPLDQDSCNLNWDNRRNLITAKYSPLSFSTASTPWWSMNSAIANNTSWALYDRNTNTKYKIGPDLAWGGNTQTYQIEAIGGGYVLLDVGGNALTLRTVDDIKTAGYQAAPPSFATNPLYVVSGQTGTYVGPSTSAYPIGGSGRLGQIFEEGDTTYILWGCCTGSNGTGTKMWIVPMPTRP